MIKWTPHQAMYNMFNDKYEDESMSDKIMVYVAADNRHKFTHNVQYLFHKMGCVDELMVTMCGLQFRDYEFRYIRDLIILRGLSSDNYIWFMSRDNTRYYTAIRQEARLRQLKIFDPAVFSATTVEQNMCETCLGGGFIAALYPTGHHEVKCEDCEGSGYSDTGLKLVPKVCTHKWIKYVGMTDVYDYCEHCDEKRSK